MGGHLEVLKWARENGCPWDEWTRELDGSKGYVESEMLFSQHQLP